MQPDQQNQTPEQPDVPQPAYTPPAEQPQAQDFSPVAEQPAPEVTEVPNGTWQQPEAPRAADAYVVETPQADEASAEQPVEVQGEEYADQGEPHESDDQYVRWQAPEHIYREKDALWYSIFAGVVVVMIVGALLLMGSWSFALLVPVMAAALLIYARRPPVMIDYTLSRKGLHINDRLYPYDEFKEFGLVHGAEEHSFQLVPRKRFHAGVMVYFPEEAGEAIVDMLAARLPMHEVKVDPIDRIIRALRI